MAKIGCPCGNVLVDVSDRHYYKSWTITDKQWDAFWEAIDDAIEHSGNSEKEKEISTMTIRAVGWRAARHQFQCPKCGRILVQLSNGGFESFKPERDETNKMLFDEVLEMSPNNDKRILARWQEFLSRQKK